VVDDPAFAIDHIDEDADSDPAPASAGEQRLTVDLDDKRNLGSAVFFASVFSTASAARTPT